MKHNTTDSGPLFHLVPDRLAAAGREEAPLTRTHPVHSVSSIAVRSDSVGVDPLGWRLTDPEVAPDEDAVEVGVRLDPVAGAGGLLLLLVHDGTGRRPRVNGHVVPLVTSLLPGDHVDAGAGVAFHVTLHRPPPVTVATPALVGSECHLCRVPFREGDEVFVCAGCGAALHHRQASSDAGAGDHSEDGAAPAAETLECVLAVTSCPSCEQTVHLEGGFSHDPENGW